MAHEIQYVRRVRMDGVGQFFSTSAETFCLRDVKMLKLVAIKRLLLIRLEHFFCLFTVEDFVVIFESFRNRISLERLSFQKWHFIF